MKLSTAVLACMDRRTLDAIMNTGALSKSEIGAINALRSSGGRANEVIAKRRLEQAVTKQFAGKDKQMLKLERGVYEYAKQRFAEQEKPMTKTTDLLEERVAKSRDVQRMLSDTIAKYQAAHPHLRKENILQAVLDGPAVRDMVDLERRLDEVVKAKNTLPQPGATTDIDFSNPLRGTAGYNPSLDDRRPGTPHASGGPQSGKEDQPVIEDANTVLERLVKEHMRQGKSRARAVMDASATKEFGDAHRAERARKFGV